MRYFILGGIALSLALAIFLSPFASPHPDGLERVAENKGFIEHEAEHQILPSPLPDYTIPGIGSERVSTALAGLIGTLACFGAAIGLGLAFRRKASNPESSPPEKEQGEA